MAMEEYSKNYARRLAKVVADFRKFDEGQKLDTLRLAEIACDDMDNCPDLLRGLGDIVERVCKSRGIDEFKEEQARGK